MDLTTISVNEIVEIKTEKKWIERQLYIIETDKRSFEVDKKVCEIKLKELKSENWFWKRINKGRIEYRKRDLISKDNGISFCKMLLYDINRKCKRGRHKYTVRESPSGYLFNSKTGRMIKPEEIDTKVCQHCQLPKGIFKKK